MAKAHFRKTLQQEFGDLVGFITRNDYRMFVYTSTLSVHDLVLEYGTLQSELETMKSSPFENSVVKKAACRIREERN